MKANSKVLKVVFILLLYLFLCVPLGTVLWAEALPEAPFLPAYNSVTPEKIELGRKLFFDKRLSKLGALSCNSCHDIVSGSGTLPQWNKTLKLDRDPPTLWNVAFQSAFFWDGHALTLEDQVKEHFLGSQGMGHSDVNDVVTTLSSIPSYVAHFRRIFETENSITIDNIAQTIATFERTLVTPNSPYDLYQDGDVLSFPIEALRGMEKFNAVGCTNCHMGTMMNGPNMPWGQAFLVLFPLYSSPRIEQNFSFLKDPGLFNVSQKTYQKYMWRVPTLRNIALTAPYFHNGSVKTLPGAVAVMAKTSLNKKISKQDIQDIVAFLESLTGKIPTYIEPIFSDETLQSEVPPPATAFTPQ